jgi:ATP-dependent Clp protease ATP-binding subunit ClpA
MNQPTPGLAVAWRIAATEAGAAGYAKIECAHLLMGLLSLDKADPRILKELGFDEGQLVQVGGEQAATSGLFEAADVSPRTLRRDLTAQARAGEIGPVIGRRKEILGVLQTLARSTKSNPLLVGEAGVGKTAIVEAIAIRGVAGKDEQVLGGRRIVELNVGSLLAGTEYRGEFEKRMKELLDELRASKDVILFIDEIHTVVGAGRAGSGLDAANLLKPALARGEIRVIGATTIREFRETIEKDAALERREFLNRVDDIIAFSTLDEADVRRIARPLLAALIAKVRKTHGVFVRFEPEAEAFVVRSGFDAEKGVRELKRVIERLVEMPLSSLALSGKLARHPSWKAVYDEGGVYFLPE